MLTNATLRLLFLINCLIALSTLPAFATADTAKQSIDLLIEGDYVLTMNHDFDIIEKGAVAINNDKIIQVGTQPELSAIYQAKTIIGGENKVVMPGLINGHTHTAMTLFRGIADDLPLMQWLTEYIFPLEGEFVSPEFIKVGAQLACYEMIRTGTTTFVDMYFHPDVIAQVTIDCGLRAILASPMIDYPSPGFKGWQDSHAAGVTFVKQWQNKHPRVTPALAPHAPYTVSPEHLQEVGNSARELDAPISIHLAETETEIQQIKQRHQNSAVSHALQNLGDNRIIGAHLVYPQAQDFAAMKTKRFGAIHNPTSNAKLASGIAPVTQLLEQGIQVGLGTDGAASNNDLNLFEEIKMAALLHKLLEKNPEALPAQQALSLATRHGAHAIGMSDRIGQLNAGFDADIIQVGFGNILAQPVYDITSHLVYVLGGRDVVTSVVGGEVLMRDGQVLTIDEAALKKDIAKLRKSIRARVHQNSGSQTLN